MRDSGGTDHGGVDTSFSQTFTVEVFPKNDPLSFSLSVSDVIVREDTGCILEPSMSWVDLVEPACATITDRTQNLTHVYPGFVISMDMGPYEKGPLPDFGAGGNLWTLAGVCETGPVVYTFLDLWFPRLHVVSSEIKSHIQFWNCKVLLFQLLSVAHNCYLSIYLYLSTYLSTYLSIYLATYVSMYM
jgi:hypothetical protein